MTRSGLFNGANNFFRRNHRVVYISTSMDYTGEYIARSRSVVAQRVCVAWPCSVFAQCACAVCNCVAVVGAATGNTTVVGRRGLQHSRRQIPGPRTWESWGSGSTTQPSSDSAKQKRREWHAVRSRGPRYSRRPAPEPKTRLS